MFGIRGDVAGSIGVQDGLGIGVVRGVVVGMEGGISGTASGVETVAAALRQLPGKARHVGCAHWVGVRLAMWLRAAKEDWVSGLTGVSIIQTYSLRGARRDGGGPASACICS